jgi:D-tyrosyl-tRNA(Tyr) deacylase
MLAVIQRVTNATVSVNQTIIGAIQQGILALIGIEKTDTEKQADRLLERILTYRIFNDSADKMNMSIKDIQGGLLLVSQFTIVADTKTGTRPGFSVAMAPEQSKLLFDYMVQHAKSNYLKVASGEFGANMQISLCNDGPVTFLLRS